MKKTYGLFTIILFIIGFIFGGYISPQDSFSFLVAVPVGIIAGIGGLIIDISLSKI